MSKLGPILKEKRESLNISIEEVSLHLKINKTIVVKLEEGEFYSLPSYVYAYGFVKKYAEFLKIDFEDIKDIFQEECVKDEYNISFTPINSKKLEHKVAANPINSKKLILMILILLVILGGIFYFKYVSNKSQAVNKKTENYTPVMLSNKSDNKSDNSSDNNSINTEINNKNLIDKDINKKKEESDKNKIIKTEVLPEKKENADKNETKKVVDKDSLKEAKLVFIDVCWIHLNIDGEKQIDFIAQPKEIKTVKFKKYFILDIGNAAAVSVKYKKKRISGFGAYRQPVKHLKFTLDDNGHLIYSKLK